jgi:hypothetical protein
VPKKEKRKKDIPAPLSEELCYASLCGVLSRACAVLNIPWKHDDNYSICENQIRAFDRWLTEKQFPKSPEKVDNVSKEDKTILDVPFSA